MIKCLSNNIINYFVKSNIIDDEIEVYQYGLELVISSVIGVLGVLAISLLCNQFVEGLIYLISFVVIRRYTGGYHCKTYFTCKASFLGILVIYLLLSRVITTDLILNVIGILSAGVIWFLAPCDHENKVLSTSEKHRYGNISKVIIILYSLMIYIGYQTGSIYTVCMEMMLVIIAVLLIIGKIERRISNEKN